ncbi:hypothetical protein D3880_15310 [Pseudomonas cavernae]|uniref:Uncharacterized protein n=1 Tax=Pseudomonas cavernae TaxID=2320867 RepID=A0A385Z4M8_9PSED|nr:hypothetical protein D3880_15310 [Pseudomonas cavernae]
MAAVAATQRILRVKRCRRTGTWRFPH